MRIEHDFRFKLLNLNVAKFHFNPGDNQKNTSTFEKQLQLELQCTVYILSAFKSAITGWISPPGFFFSCFGILVLCKLIPSHLIMYPS